jgi:hypothetical protein
VTIASEYALNSSASYNISSFHSFDAMESDIKNIDNLISSSTKIPYLKSIIAKSIINKELWYRSLNEKNINKNIYSSFSGIKYDGKSGEPARVCLSIATYLNIKSNKPIFNYFHQDILFAKINSPAIFLSLYINYKILNQLNLKCDVCKRKIILDHNCTKEITYRFCKNFRNMP